MRIDIKYLKLLFFVTLQFILNVQLVVGQTYGLKFKSHDVTLDSRTELDLTPDEYLTFQDEFEISFDFKPAFEKHNTSFGYVFRIISNDDYNIDLLSTPDPRPQLNVVLGKINSIIPVQYPANALNNWINIRVKFLLREDRLIFYTPDTFYVKEHVGFNPRESFKIIFGANYFKQFKNSDVPSMIIKNINIFERGKLKYQWTLDKEESGNVIKDNIKGRKAIVKNPIWINVYHQYWQEEYENEITGNILFATDTENSRIFLIGKDALCIFSVLNNSVREIKYKNRPRFFDNNYRAVYNTIDQKIYCYLVDRIPFYVLDVTTGEWNETGVATGSTTKYRHHNFYFNASDNSLFLFGGYGLHKYNNEIRKIDFTNKTIDYLPTHDSIFAPRYLAGLGSLNDTLYILGGYGSESGNQLINPHSFFDLFGYSIKDNNLFKKFEIPHLIDDMIVGNSMWIDAENRYYYALIFSKIKFKGQLQLIRGNLDSPEIKLVGDKIPFKFLDIRSFASLSYMPQINKIYTYTSYATDSTTQIKIYSINNPPNLSIPDGVNVNDNFNIHLIYFLFAVLVLFGTGGWYYRKKRKSTVVLDEINEKQDEALSNTTEKLEVDAVAKQPKYHIVFFGGFQVFDSGFSDITNKFSPVLKELFLLIYLHTFKEDKGISAEKITEILWYNKSEKSAQNNRAVNIKKLRTILAKIGACQLSKKTGYWKVIFNESEIKSDYVDFLHLTSSKTNLTKDKILQLIEITKKGAFLLNVQYKWLDEFKATVSDIIIDTLIFFAASCEIKEDADLISHLADCVFHFDVTNEDAMKLKCRAQYFEGKHSHAKATYDKFFEEYKLMYGQEYEKSFVDILNGVY